MQILLAGPGDAPARFSGGLFDPSGFDILEFHEERCPGRMNELLAPAAMELLDRRSGATLQGVACVRGPGSFTGVRLGLAFATGLCLARTLPMAGLDHLPLLALRAPRGYGEVHVVTHSRTGQVYHQAFGPGALPYSTPEDMDAARARHLAAHAVSRSGKGRVALLGTGLARNPEAFADIAGTVLLEQQAPTPQALLRAALAARYDGPPVDALYLRGSDAEENLATIGAQRGLTPLQAQSRLDKAQRDGTPVWSA
ncbi:tRNA threonylcarbamoyladenosine biosynthesis protein TsaB [Fundidesulfovibrio magnetotacticus]|uniref:tRNA threonylcarbamoyladenosine biosynthesis protein TsaB n=2 Tax=Fundidesulfovibrio magnetotacticus TaxID=2730080 RepID=A0A6V8LSV8_9BACT|nr:tRNA threonylcarbamoyladenosine biosynthesis protein TsaB [Fundidesulfovibrio magnetotacticus]